MDSVKLEHFKNKQEDAKSAVASQEVREHLASFILSKRLGSASQLPTSSEASDPNQNLPVSGEQRSYERNDRSGAQSSVLNSNQRTCSFATSASPTYIVELGSSARVCDGRQNETDDHPLRKTASMPTMHIQGKAQSMSRRKQIERRTTLSPLMRRKSRPNRSTQSSGQSFNASDQQALSTNSQSRASSSPPPHTSTVSFAQDQSSFVSAKPSHAYIYKHQLEHLNACDVDMLKNKLQEFYSPHFRLNSSGADIVTNESSVHINGCVNSQISLHKARSNPQLMNDDTNQSMDVEMLQRDYCEGLISKSNLAQPTSRLSRLGTLELIDAGTGKLAQKLSSGDENPKLVEPVLNASHFFDLSAQTSREKQLFKDAQTFLRQQQHQKVNEVIRKTVLNRSTSRGKVLATGSLDIDTLNHTNISAVAGSRPTPNQFGGSALRQWSLDSGDIRSSSKIWMNSGKQATMVGFRDSHKARLGATNEAASLRRCQSPNSSISMGRANTLISAHRKQSSSSSSTSSILSQQDSLEDSLSQAIDLSSSSEASRNKQSISLKTHRQQTLAREEPEALGHQISVAHVSNSQCCPSVLQESFNQMQLCQRHQIGHGNIQRILCSMNGPASTAEAHPPRLSGENKTSCSLDTGGVSLYQQPATFFASLSDQFDLSTSAQNLISADPQISNYSANLTSHLNNLSDFLQQSVDQSNQRFAFDYNSLLRNSTNFSFPHLQPQPTQQQTQQKPQSQPQIAPLPAELSALSESYRASLITQLVQQQQQQQQQQQRHAQTYLTDSQLAEELRKRGVEAVVHKSLIGRTLSSPLLPTGAASNEQFGKQHSVHITAAATAAIPSNVGKSKVKQMSVDGDDDDDDDDSNNWMRREDREARKSDEFETDSSLDLSLNNLSAPTAYRAAKSSSCSLDAKGAAEAKDTLAQAKPFLNFTYSSLDAELYNARYILTPVFDRFSETGITYELELCNHKCICGNEANHPENSRRILTIWRRLYDAGLMARCTKLEARLATFDELQLCHK